MICIFRHALQDPLRLSSWHYHYEIGVYSDVTSLTVAYRWLDIVGRWFSRRLDGSCAITEGTTAQSACPARRQDLWRQFHRRSLIFQSRCNHTRTHMHNKITCTSLFSVASSTRHDATLSARARVTMAVSRAWRKTVAVDDSWVKLRGVDTVDYMRYQLVL